MVYCDLKSAQMYAFTVLVRYFSTGAAAQRGARAIRSFCGDDDIVMLSLHPPLQNCKSYNHILWHICSWINSDLILWDLKSPKIVEGDADLAPTLYNLQNPLNSTETANGAPKCMTALMLKMHLHSMRLYLKSHVLTFLLDLLHWTYQLVRIGMVFCGRRILNIFPISIHGISLCFGKFKEFSALSSIIAIDYFISKLFILEFYYWII